LLIYFSKKCHVLIKKNATIRPVETIQRRGGEGTKENGGGGEFNYDIM
jgi:hypothetical protein